MKIKLYLTVTIMSIVLLTSCMKVPNFNIVRSKDYRENAYIDHQNRLFYFGAMKKETNDRIYQLYEESEIKPNTLVITSQGGDVFLGMELGDFVFDNQLNVEVNYFCISSCANYVFTAAKKKFLQPESLLVWHGSSWQPDLNEKYLKGDEILVKWRNLEIQFFKKIAVDYKITTAGFGQYKFSDYFKAHLLRKPIMGFNYSIEDMEKFGVDQVYFTENKWNWQKANKCCHILRVNTGLE